MSIDLEAKVKSNKEWEKKVFNNLNDRISSYFNSKCRRVLKNRYDKLFASNDMRIGAWSKNTNTFKANLVFPLVKERALLRESIYALNFRNDPLFTLVPQHDTSIDSAIKMQTVLNMNLRSTAFRMTAFRCVMQSTAKFGSSILYSTFVEKNKVARKTVPGPFGPERKNVVVDARQNVVNRHVHILDYFQEPDVADYKCSDINGHIDCIKISDLISMSKINSDSYLKENLQWIIKEAKKSAITDSDKFDFHSEDLSKHSIDVKRGYAVINIAGNEDDQNHYYFEIVGGKLIRFELNPNDEDLVPYSVFGIHKRPEYWWSNSDSELVLTHENYTNLIMGIKADRALQDLQSYIFYGAGTIDSGDWNRRHLNGGLIPVELKDGKRLSDILYQFLPQDNSLASTDSIMREVKESQQKISTQPDLSRGAKQGGVRNQTATAALILEEQGDAQESFILENFQYGLKNMAQINVTLLQQYLGDIIEIRPDRDKPFEQIRKEEVLGAYDFIAETSLTKNKSSELIRLQNALTTIQNFKGSGDPQWQNINLEPIIKNWFRKLDVGDVDEIIPPQQPQQQQQMMAGGLPPELAGAIPA